MSMLQWRRGFRAKLGDHKGMNDVPPYEKLAEVYDYLMRHVDYVEWADYIEEVFHKYDSTPVRIFEVACGTGTMAVELTRRGYVVRGTDVSETMIDAAMSKTGVDGSPTFEVADMRSLPEDNADAVLCLYDSLNYNLDEQDVGISIANMRRCVHPGALCIFDITTETNSLLYFRNYQAKERHAGYTYTRKSRYERDERLQINEFEIRPNGSSQTIHERHQQRIYDVNTVLNSVDEASWQILDIFDDFTFEPADNSSERVHIILRAV
jgi:SAM-dependent methyltransferase